MNKQSQSKRVVFAIILVAIIILIYFVGKTPAKNKTSPTPSPTPTVTTQPTTSPTPKLLSSKLLYLLAGDVNTINSTNGNSKTVIYSDASSNAKIRKIGNISSASKEIVSLNSLNSTDTNLDLNLISASNNTSRLIKADFSTSDLPTPQISPDGHEIVHITFSNSEVNYGYTISSYNLTTKKDNPIYTSEQEIESLSWSPDGDYIVYAAFDSSKNIISFYKLDSFNHRNSLLFVSNKKSASNIQFISNTSFIYRTSANANSSLSSIYKFDMSDSESSLYNDTSTISFAVDGNLLAYIPENKSDIIILDDNVQKFTISNSKAIIGWLD